MILTKIWERNIFFRTLQLILFFLLAIFTVFVVIDFSIHSAKIFSNSGVKFLDIINYYKNLFIIELNIFLSLTLMLAMIKVLSEMNIHHELTALQMAGISGKKIFRPFLILAILVAVISYLNFQNFLPKALDYKNSFKEKFLKKTKYKKIHPNVIYLEDNTRLVYQKYTTSKKELFDVYFVKSNSDIWHAKYLYLDKTPIIGKWVDHLIRKGDFFEKDKSFDHFEFKDIELTSSCNLFVPIGNRAISTLYKQSRSSFICQKEKVELLSHLNYKLSMPLFAILLILAIFPYLLRFSKNISIFFICTFSIFGFVIFHTIMDSTLIIAENTQNVPYVIIWIPMILGFIIFGRRFSKI